MERSHAYSEAGTTAPGGSAARRALVLLRREHRWLLEQLTAVEAADDDPGVGDRVRIVCMELAEHSALEHQLFYPALDATLSDTDAIGVARVEHGLLDRLSDRLLHSDPGDPLFRPLVRVLRAALSRHMATEESWFGEANELALEWPRLVAALQTRQRERGRLQHAPSPVRNGSG